MLSAETLVGRQQGHIAEQKLQGMHHDDNIHCGGASCLTGLTGSGCRGRNYDELVAETVGALQARYGTSILIHWEDFASRNSYRLLQRYRDEVGALRLLLHPPPPLPSAHTPLAVHAKSQGSSKSP